MPELNEFWIFLCVGFFAQLIDGALGMGYGVISSVVLLASGVPPAHTSASVHSAKLFTTAASGASHLLHGNVDRRLFWFLSLAGGVGGILGALILTQVLATSSDPMCSATSCSWACSSSGAALGKERNVMYCRVALSLHSAVLAASSMRSAAVAGARS
jgi:uncharacterized membrane protein YfcA